MKNKKIWILAVLAIIAFAQISVLYEFHYMSANGQFQGEAVVAVLKEKYVYARVLFTIFGQGTITFSNGTQVSFGGGNQPFSFRLTFPSTGSIISGFSSSEIEGMNLNQSQPLVARVITNATSLDFNLLYSYPGTVLSSNYFDDYWFIVNGSGNVAIQGYGTTL